MSRKFKIVLLILLFIFLILLPRAAYAYMGGIAVLIVFLVPCIIAGFLSINIKLASLKTIFKGNIKEKEFYALVVTVLEIVFLLIFWDFWSSIADYGYVPYLGTFFSVYLVALFPNLLLLQNNKDFLNFKNIVYDKKRIIGAIAFALIFPLISVILYYIMVKILSR